MKKNSLVSSKLAKCVLLTGVALSTGGGMVYASEDLSASVSQQTEQTTKYSAEVMEVLRLSLGGNEESTELDSLINKMPKVEVMDRYLSSFGSKVKGNEVRKAVMAVFGADLNYVSENNYGSKLAIYNSSVMEALRISLNVSPESTELDEKIMAMTKNEVMDSYIKVHGYALTGAEYRVLINQIFGVNLDGISGLEHARISIYSKGQWILQEDTNLFMVSSSLDDVELYVATTDYFAESTGSNLLPESLIQTLVGLGFTYDAAQDRYVYSNPTNESVPDAIKGQVIGAVVGTVKTEYTN